MKSLQLLMMFCLSTTLMSQQFEGIIEYQETENENKYVVMLMEMLNRPGPIERYMKKEVRVYIAGDTLICETYDSLGELIQTSLQIGKRIYSNSNFGSQIFKDMSYYPPSISLITNWTKVEKSETPNTKSNLVHYLGSEQTNSRQTIEIGLEKISVDKSQINKTGLFKYFFYENGLVQFERLIYKEMTRVKKDYQYTNQEVSDICKNKVESYYIE